MTDYFNSVGTKSSLRSDKVFDFEDSKPDLLLKFRNDTDPISRVDKLEEVDRLYGNWCDRLFRGYNIVVQGRQSKFRLLETFKKRYLDSEQILDLDDETGTRNLHITTVRLHGFTPISLQTFQHAIFGHVEGKLFNKEKELKSFVERLRKTKKHFVFLIHSLDFFLKECKNIFQLIFQLYKYEPTLIHLLASTDHINAAIILFPFRIPQDELNLIFYHASYGISFIYERVHRVELIDQQVDDTKDDLAIYNSVLDLQSLKDVYQALQRACQSIMIYIFEHYLEQCQRLAFIREASVKKRRTTGRITRQSVMSGQEIEHVPQADDVVEVGLDFNQLSKYCESNFFARRSNVLKNHLGELIDHRLIRWGKSKNTIVCIVNKNTCEKFLQHIKDSNKDE